MGVSASAQYEYIGRFLTIWHPTISTLVPLSGLAFPFVRPFFPISSMAQLKSILVVASVFVLASADANASVPILTGTSVTTSFGTFNLTSTAACACNKLATLYPEGILFPNSTNYTSVNIETWDIRTDLDPACIFLPETADQVAAGINVLNGCDAQFAVRSGGHMNVSLHPADLLSRFNEALHFLVVPWREQYQWRCVGRLE